MQNHKLLLNLQKCKTQSTGKLPVATSHFSFFARYSFSPQHEISAYSEFWCEIVQCGCVCPVDISVSDVEENSQSAPLWSTTRMYVMKVSAL